MSNNESNVSDNNIFNISNNISNRLPKEFFLKAMEFFLLKQRRLQD